ncbi:MAG: transketolase [Lachnospiraceae bacterium]|nr:transketolase [Lachnospiraceae bacterium]
MVLQEKAAELRGDILKMIHAAGNGHPGGSLSVIDILVALYYNVANVDPSNPKWEDRDRIVLSKGHACPALYAVLADKGYFPKEDLWTLRKIDSHLQGHPDMKKTPGVDLNTGSLGQGVAVATGMAIAAKHLGKNYHVYAIVGDGECQEGLVWEAAMAAAHYKLDNLTVILDHNGLQIDGTNDEVMSLGDPVEKYKAFGFETFTVNGHDIDALTDVLKTPVHGKPKFICAKTVKGKGVSFMENQAGWHGKAPSADELAKALAELGVN